MPKRTPHSRKLDRKDRFTNACTPTRRRWKRRIKRRRTWSLSSTSLSTRKSSWTTSRATTRTCESESRACVTRLFSLRRASVAWKRQSKSLEKTPGPRTRKVSLPHGRRLRRTIKSWRWSANMKREKRLLKRISSVCRSSWKRRIRMSSTTTTASHARWRLNRARLQNRSSLTRLRYWLSGSIRQSTRMSKRSVCLTSTWEMPRLSRRPLKRSWRRQESITLTRSSLPSSKLKSKTSSFSTTLTSWIRRMISLKSHQLTMISRSHSTRSLAGSIRTISPLKSTRWRVIIKSSVRKL